MFVNASSVDFSQYDVIVAGSGFAGHALAERLSEHARKVLILETGGLEYDTEIEETFNVMYGRGHFDGNHWPYHWVRALGGTSAVWGGWCSPLMDRNFADWPITAADLAPYYATAARALGRNENTATFSAPALEGFIYRPMSTELPVRLGEETSTFEALTGVDVLLNATMAGLEATPDRSAIVAFDVAIGGGAENRRVALAAGQSIVLAAGGIGNPQILLGSAMPDGPAVGNETDQVGRYLMEHPHFLGCARLVVRSDFRLPGPPGGFGEYSDLIVPDDEVFERIGALDVGMVFGSSRPSTEDPVEDYLLQQYGSGAQVFELNIVSEMSPDPRNRVTATDATDPAGLPLMRSHCVIDTDAFLAVDTCLTELGNMLTRTDMGRLRVFNEELYFRVSGGGHIMGTTRMGDDPATSVVDSDCRVHGYGNLFIAGSSVFTTGGYANPTLTLVALAHRLGDTLAGKGS